MEHVELTRLYVPASSPERLGKALASGADVVTVDLEDSVLEVDKNAAREIAVEALRHRVHGARLEVRINHPGGSHGARDLDALRAAGDGLDVRVPKVEHPDDVAAVLERLGGTTRVHCLIESALGLERCFEIACLPGVAGIALGEADLAADLGAEEAGLSWARGRIVAAAAAAGLTPPAMSVYTYVGDDNGLYRSTVAGRGFGFLGRAAIHPRQLPVIERAFRPTPAELSRAREILAGAEEGEDAGRGAILLPSGRFVDRAVVRAAHRVVALAARLDSRQ